MKKVLSGLFIVALLVSTAAFAQPADDEQEGRRGGGRGHRGPPQEAIDACEGLAEGDSCSFVIEAQGTCESLRRSEGVVCRPEGHGRGGREPRQESQE